MSHEEPVLTIASDSHETQLSNSALKFDANLKNFGYNLSEMEIAEFNRRHTFANATINALVQLEVKDHFLQIRLSKKKESGDRAKRVMFVIAAILLILSFVTNDEFIDAHAFELIIIASLYFVFHGLEEKTIKDELELNDRFREMYKRDLHGIGFHGLRLDESVAYSKKLYLEGYAAHESELKSMELDYKLRMALIGQLKQKEFSHNYVARHCQDPE